MLSNLNFLLVHCVFTYRGRLCNSTDFIHWSASCRVLNSRCSSCDVRKGGVAVAVASVGNVVG